MKAGDKRKLHKPMSLRTSYSIEHLLAGDIIEIQQVDAKSHQVLVRNVWKYGPSIASISDPVEV